MNITDLKLKGAKLIEPKVFKDARGFFFESYSEKNFYEKVAPVRFVQDNISRSKYGVLRGLHYQLKYPQGKLVTVIRGEVFDVLVDIRRDSETFGKWEGVILNDQNHLALYIPPGFAHGFCVTSEEVDFHYKCTDFYHPEDEHGIIWNDPTIAIDWPRLSFEPILSAKDLRNEKFECVPF